MKQPTPSQLSAWHMAQPAGDYTCSDCGKVGPKAYIQPQHPFYAGGREGTALCGNCIAAANERARQTRKAQLDAMPRCELCQRRGQWTIRGVLLCGAHWRRLKAAHARSMEGLGGMALFLPPPDYTRDELLEMARGRAS